MKFRLGGGSFLGLVIGALVLVVTALRWAGKNAQAIGAGVGVLVQVAAVCAVLAGAGALGWKIWQSRQPRERVPDQPLPPVHADSVQVPLPARRDEPLALPPGGTHYHFTVTDPETAAELARALRGEDRG